VIAPSTYPTNTSFNYSISSVQTSIISFKGLYWSRTKDSLPFKQVKVQCLQVLRFLLVVTTLFLVGNFKIKDHVLIIVLIAKEAFLILWNCRLKPCLFKGETSWLRADHYWDLQGILYETSDLSILIKEVFTEVILILQSINVNENYLHIINADAQIIELYI